MNRKLFRYSHLILSTLALLVGVAYIFSHQDKESIFPSENPAIVYNAAHEALDSNWSESVLVRKPDGLHFQYRLTKAKEEPFASVFFHKISDQDPFFDVRDYNELYLNFTADKAQRVPFSITVDVPGFTSTSKELSHVPLSTILDCKKGENQYRIAFKELEIPSWWLRHHQLDKSFAERIDFSRVSYFVLNSCQVLDKNVPDTIILKSLVLQQNHQPLWIFLFGLVGLSLLLEGIIRIRKNKKTELYFTPTNTLETPSNETEKIIQYIATHYSNPELVIGDVQKGVGISSRKISGLLQARFAMSFTDYVNQIRIAEVKRLLKETKLPVSEIAYNAGFSNISHFNRVFKTITGVSPSQFREH
jgi:AraC-like DNA-binding protein